MRKVVPPRKLTNDGWIVPSGPVMVTSATLRLSWRIGSLKVNVMAVLGVVFATYLFRWY